MPLLDPGEQQIFKLEPVPLTPLPAVYAIVRACLEIVVCLGARGAPRHCAPHERYPCGDPLHTLKYAICTMHRAAEEMGE